MSAKTRPTHCQSYARRVDPGYRHARAAATTYTPDQIAALYLFPKLTGAHAGAVIAVGELGGGYVLKDVQSYFAGLGLPAPNVTDVSVRGAVNSPDGDPNGADGEVMLDILVAAAAYSYSTGLPATILMVFAPNDATGIADAISAAAAHPSKPAVMSWSWGGPEDSWDAASITATEAALQSAASAGMTVTAAAGDNGSGDGDRSGNHVDYPASSASVLACGGTSLPGGNLAAESVWNDGSQGGSTGGGVSALFGAPAWQSGFLPSGFKGRGVPDVAGDADPETGYSIVIDGTSAVIGGTSAVAPLMAALVAVLCAATGKRFGVINPLFYSESSEFRDVTSGNNGAFAAGVGWDADTGLGVPVGNSILKAIQGGTMPVTPTNPVGPPVVVAPPVATGPTLAQVQAIVDASFTQSATAFRFVPGAARYFANEIAAVNAQLSSLFASRAAHAFGLPTVNWAEVEATVESMLKTFGPIAVPFIEKYVSGLNLPPAVLAAVDALIEQYVGKAA
jgi:kumamolisin